MKDSQIMVLGASGWLSHYLIPEILKPNGAGVLAGYFTNQPKFDFPKVNPFQFSAGNFSAIENLTPSLIINLARGEEEIDFQFHKQLIDFCNQKKIRYLYASSANAFDATPQVFHNEADKPVANSPYGKHKARCEEELFKHCNRPLAFRFAATHGWAPNRVARTETFLQSLKNNEKLPVNTGVIQNRTFVGDLARMISTLISDNEAEGLFHLGTSDWSEEKHFLQKMARAFGYDANQIVEDESFQWNAVVLPERWQKRYPHLLPPTENETIQKVREQKQFHRYVKN
jgi:dTDP-4-dehydrorhamnose reductase